MKLKHFVQQLDRDRLIAAIKDAERGNSGDVVLFISHHKIVNVVSSAHATFSELKLAQTTPLNSVLIFVAPKSQQLAIIGGKDLHEKLPSEWWSNLVAKVTAHFANGELNDGLINALSEIGVAQRIYFPTSQNIDRANQKDLLEDV